VTPSSAELPIRRVTDRDRRGQSGAVPSQDDPAVQALLDAARECLAIERELQLEPAERDLLRAAHEAKTSYPDELSAKLARLTPKRHAAMEALQRAVEVIDGGPTEAGS
jgi:hypothetical protein